MKTRSGFRSGFLLRTRRHREFAACRAFVAARVEAASIEGRINRLQKALSQYAETIRRQLQSGSAQVQSGYRDTMADIRLKLAELNAQLSRAGRTLEHRRTELVEAMKHRKAMSRLTENLAARQAADAARREVKESDDLYLTFTAAGRAELNRASHVGCTRN